MRHKNTLKSLIYNTLKQFYFLLNNIVFYSHFLRYNSSKYNANYNAKIYLKIRVYQHIV